MKRAISFLLFWIFSSIATAGSWSINPYGYGSVKIGMTVQQAEKLLGTKLIPDEDGTNSECYHVQPKQGHNGVSLMIKGDKITRVSIYGGPSQIKTDKGIGVGDSEMKVIRAYGKNLEIEPHYYGSYPDDKYLTYWTKNRKFGVRYETIHGTVETIHGGSTAIQYVEGCL